MAGIKEEKKIYLVGIYCRLSKDDGTDIGQSRCNCITTSNIPSLSIIHHIFIQQAK